MRVLIEETVKIVCYSDLISPSAAVCAMCEYGDDCSLYDTNSGDTVQGVRLSGDLK